MDIDARHTNREKQTLRVLLVQNHEPGKPLDVVAYTCKGQLPNVLNQMEHCEGLVLGPLTMLERWELDPRHQLGSQLAFYQNGFLSRRCTRLTLGRA